MHKFKLIGIFVDIEILPNQVGIYGSRMFTSPTKIAKTCPKMVDISPNINLDGFLSRMRRNVVGLIQDETNLQLHRKHTYISENMLRQSQVPSKMRHTTSSN